MEVAGRRVIALILIANEMSYAKLGTFACGRDMETDRVRLRVRLSAEYVQEAQATIERQLAMAGFRLAYILNRVLGD